MSVLDTEHPSSAHTSASEISLAEVFALLSEAEQAQLLDKLSDDDRARYRYDWGFWSRPKQRAPDGDWRVWLLLAGRGFGKSRAGNEWVREQVERHNKGTIAIVGPTAADVRDVLIEGPSGILTISPPWFRPVYEPSKRKLTWPNGAVAHLYSAEEPDRLRGPQHDAAYCDEIASFAYPVALDMLMFGLRLGSDPRLCITTTPRPIPIIKNLLNDPTCRVVRGTSYENIANLAPAFFAQVVKKYEGTRLGRQELLAEILDDVPGALWSLGLIERTRVLTLDRATLTRIVVAVDPPASSPKSVENKKSEDERGPSECGIIVAGRTHEHAYVLEDASGHASPLQWAARAVALYHQYGADRIVCEANMGGEMVEQTIKTVDAAVPVKLVHATRGKLTRAEPVAALWEKGTAHMLGAFPKLEDQLCVAPWTLVQTARGLLPVIQVERGDLVSTRDGFRRVLWVGRTGYAPLLRLHISNGAVLSLTAKHPVGTPNGFRLASSLRPGDEVLVCQCRSCVSIACSVASSFSSKNTGTIAPVGGIDAGEGNCFIEWCGKRFADRSPKDMTYIISTEIERTISSPILNASREKNTPRNMSGPLAWHTVEKSLEEVSCGGSANRQHSESVRNVSVGLNPRLSGKSHSAHINVGRAIILAVEARGATCRDYRPVWNLSVEGTPEFLANTVLTHNCSYVGEPPSPDRLDACLVAGTLVETDQAAIPIERVRAGMRVLTRVGFRQVTWAGRTCINAEVFTVEFSDGRTLTGTAEHPVWIESYGFARLGDLTRNQRALSCDNGSSRVLNVEPAGNADVFNLHVEGQHEFFANGLLVHNCVWALTELMIGPGRDVWLI